MAISEDGKSVMGIGPILVTGLAILSSLAAAATVSAAPADPSRVAMVFPPWWSASHAVTAAANEGEILGVGGVPFIVIVRRSSTTAARGARSTGALFTLSADPRSPCTFAVLDAKS
jgi:hypothetical protein